MEIEKNKPCSSQNFDVSNTDETENSNDELLQHNNDTDTARTDSWNKVVSKGKRNSAKVNFTCKLKTAVANKGRDWNLFLSRVAPDETIDNLNSHLKSICGDNCNIEISKLTTKHDSYCSFKLSLINVPFRINVLDKKFWAKGLYVRKFYNKKNE